MSVGREYTGWRRGGGDRWQIVPALSECVLGQDGCDILGPTPPPVRLPPAPPQSLVGHNCQAVIASNAQDQHQKLTRIFLINLHKNLFVSSIWVLAAIIVKQEPAVRQQKFFVSFLPRDY